MDKYISLIREKAAASESPPLACVTTYGCALNFSDGEKIKGLLCEMGYGLTESHEAADVIILNTCAVRGSAENRVFGNLGYLKRQKEERPHVIIGLCGCMAGQEHVQEKIRASYRHVDIMFSTSALGEFPRLLHEKISGGGYAFDTADYGGLSEGLSAARDSGFKALVPIMYGCDNFCTYCIVPYVRGRERSRDSATVIDEVRQLVSDGYKEITLLGQNVNSYSGGMTFPRLLRKLDEIDGDFIIRFLSSHPKDAGTELLDAVIECGKVAKHLHLPVQSGSDEVLAMMNRNYKVSDYIEKADYLRSRIPGFSLGSDIIVGFPNETRAQFEDTLKLVREMKFDSLYSFVFSPKQGTQAAQIVDTLSAKEKSERITELIALQKSITEVNLKRFLGKTVRVLAESEGRKDGFLQGKSDEFIATDFKAPKNQIGNFFNVVIEKTRNWEMEGSIVFAP